jgi:inner membrane protein
MPTIFTHAVSAAALSFITKTTKATIPRSAWIGAILCACLPDVDVIAFSLGIPYSHMFGHRGFTHSLFFAALLATVVLHFVNAGSIGKGRLWSIYFLCGASHSVLDAMTDGGLGVAFLSPFSNHRYFLPWRPIDVSPIGASRFLSPRGMAVIQSELLWIWLPCAVLLAVIWAKRKWA